MRFGFASEEDDGNLVVTGCGHVISPYSFSVVSSPFFYSITVVDYPWPTVAEVIIHSTQLRERCARRVAGVSRHQLRCSWPLIAGLRLKTMIYLIKPWFCIVSQAFCYTVAHYPRSSIISEARNSDRSAGFVLRRVSFWKEQKRRRRGWKRRVAVQLVISKWNRMEIGKNKFFNLFNFVGNVIRSILGGNWIWGLIYPVHRGTMVPFSVYRLVMLQLPRGRLVGRGGGRWREDSVRDEACNEASLCTFIL